MDSDCLIKLVKSQMKELVCRAHVVVIPAEVRREVVDQAAGHPESQIVKRNLESGSLAESADHPPAAKGEDAALNVFKKGGFDAIASDDRRFIRRLGILDIPYLTPGAILFLLTKDNEITVSEARDRLGRLSPMISDDEATIVRIKLGALAEER